MSKSKKKKKSGQPHPRSKAARAPAKLAAESAEVHDAAHKDGLADEDFVYVPRGKSRGMYIFILALMVFTLIMFVVPYGLSSLMAPRGSGSDTFMSWKHPRLGERGVSGVDFQNQKRELGLFWHMLGQRGDEFSDDEATAAFIVTDALAQEAGVQFGKADLAEAILQMFGSKEVYQQRLGRAMTPVDFETAATKVLRVQRYQSLIQSAAMVPSPEEVEEAWNQRHEEFAFEAIGLEVEPLLATARSEATDEEALRAWYQAQPPRSGAFAEDWREAQAAVELVGWPVDSAEEPTALLEKYPAHESTDFAGLARQYYDANFHTRFLRDEPITDEEGRPNLYFTFEEVEEVATREAPIHRALGTWRDELATRITDGEVVDLAAEASALGLVFVPAAGLRPLADWRGVPVVEQEEEGADPEEPEDPEEIGPPVVYVDPFTGRFVEDGIRRADPATGLSTRQIVEKDALILTRTVERSEAGPAAYEDVKDKVAEEWAKERAGQIAVERLTEAYEALAELDTSDGLHPEVDAAAFGEQALGMGSTVQRRDWFDPTAPVPTGSEESSLESYTRRVARRFLLEEGQVSEPELDLAKENAWMLRALGRREPPEMRIEPQEYQGLVQMAGFQARQAASELLSYEAFTKAYGLRLAREDERDARPDGEGPEG